MLRIYNTLTKSVEEIKPMTPGRVTMYTCGPTVYRYAHIGNLRTYLMADWIRRILTADGNEVYHIKNITDVGHMRQELVEAGGDKMIIAALEEGKTIQEIGEFYADCFWRDETRLNILPAHVFPWASQHIPEMLEMVGTLMENGSAYGAGGNIYFDVNSYPEYGKLSNNFGGDLLEGVRAEADPLKRDPRDFTLWKAAEPGRDVKWDSPWGEGFRAGTSNVRRWPTSIWANGSTSIPVAWTTCSPITKMRSPRVKALSATGTSIIGYTGSTFWLMAPRWQNRRATSFSSRTWPPAVSIRWRSDTCV